MSLVSIFEDVCDYVCIAADIICENPVETAAVVATIATGGVAFACAPAIGAAVSAAGFGVAGGTLSGAAASSAGLAALGGGSLASGGFGMAGGTAVVTTVGSVTGAAVGSGVSAAMGSARKDHSNSNSSADRIPEQPGRSFFAALNSNPNFLLKDTRPAAQKKSDACQANIMRWVSEGANRNS